MYLDHMLFSYILTHVYQYIIHITGNIVYIKYTKYITYYTHYMLANTFSKTSTNSQQILDLGWEICQRKKISSHFFYESSRKAH